MKDTHYQTIINSHFSAGLGTTQRLMVQDALQSRDAVGSTHLVVGPTILCGASKTIDPVLLNNCT